MAHETAALERWELIKNCFVLFVMKPWQHILNPIAHLLVIWIGMKLSHCGATSPQMLVWIIPEPRAQKKIMTHKTAALERWALVKDCFVCHETFVTRTQRCRILATFLDWDESFSLWSYKSANIGTDNTWTARTKKIMTHETEALERWELVKHSFVCHATLQTCTKFYCTLACILDWNEAFSLSSYESANVGTDNTWTTRTKKLWPMRQQHLKGENSSRTALFVMKPWQHVLNSIAHLLVIWIEMKLSHCGATNLQMLVWTIPEPRAQKIMTHKTAALERWELVKDCFVCHETLVTCTQLYCRPACILDWNEAFSLWSYESANVGMDNTWTARTKNHDPWDGGTWKVRTRQAQLCLPWNLSNMYSTLLHTCLSFELEWICLIVELCFFQCWYAVNMVP